MSGKYVGLTYDLDISSKLAETLRAYVDHADHEGRNIRPSVDLIAYKLGCDTSTVIRHTKKLLEMGALVATGWHESGVRVMAADFSSIPKKPPFAEWRKTHGRKAKSARYAGGGKLPSPTEDGGGGIAVPSGGLQNAIRGGGIAVPSEPSVEPSGTVICAAPAARARIDPASHIFERAVTVADKPWLAFMPDDNAASEYARHIMWIVASAAGIIGRDGKPNYDLLFAGCNDKKARNATMKRWREGAENLHTLMGRKVDEGLLTRAVTEYLRQPGAVFKDTHTIRSKVATLVMTRVTTTSDAVVPIVADPKMQMDRFGNLVYVE